ncbi:MAG: SdrD B-like domain-containing protein, partial [Dolichospermum sp.]
GPGFGEFFNDDWFSDRGNLRHAESMQGGLALIPGTDEVVAVFMDPKDSVNWSGGVRHYNTYSGTTNSSFVLFDTDDVSVDRSTFGKAASLGDIELTCDVPTFIEIGNRVWQDIDGDGIQDPSEASLSGVNVSIYKSDGTLLATTTTNSVGEYYFSSKSNLPTPSNWLGTGADTALLPSTQYYLVFGTGGQFNPSTGVLTVGGQQYSLTTPNTGEGSTAVIKNMNDNDATILASSPANAFNNYPVINVTSTPIAGEVDHTNNDGTQDVGESGVPNVKVYLLNSSNVKIDSTTTNASGLYSFNHLPNGTYKVQFNLSTLPSGYVATAANQGGDDTIDSDANTSTGITQTITLGGAENDSTLDMGIVQPVAGLGNYVWYDTDRDGIQDAGESGVPNVKVYLLNSSGVKIDSTTTNASGQYTFTGLTPGTYSVQFAVATLPSGYVISPANQGSDDAKDSDGNTTTGITAQVTLA